MVFPEMTFQSLPALLDGPPKLSPQDNPEKPHEAVYVLVELGLNPCSPMDLIHKGRKDVWPCSQSQRPSTP